MIGERPKSRRRIRPEQTALGSDIRDTTAAPVHMRWAMTFADHFVFAWLCLRLAQVSVVEIS